jgi:pimeloyl-ACP methyl ester carboxylesterase
MAEPNSFTSKPTVLLVPGAWHSAEAYDLVVPLLRDEGYPVVTVDLPSVGAEPPVESFDEDVAKVRESVESLVSLGTFVVVVLHSYSGICGGQAMRGLGISDRRAMGQDGGVLRLVYIAAVALPEGVSFMTGLEEFKKPDFRISDDGLRAWADGARHDFYNDLSDEEAAVWTAKLRHHSWKTFQSVITYAAWKHMPTTFVICENDQSFVPEAQRMLIKRATDIEPTAFDVVERLQSSHSPFLSMPSEVVRIVRRAAGEHV